MKRHLLINSISLITIISLSLTTQFAMTQSGGPGGGHTGSPGDGNLTCNTVGCHTGSATTTIAGWITSNVPVSGYVPGQTYTITATATLASSVRFGFQISPQSSTGTYLGTLIVTDPTHTQIVSTKYIEHKSAGTVGTSGFHTWTFNWIAPSAGTGTVTFYGAFNCSNNNGGSSGDQIFTSNLILNECSASTTVTANGPTDFCTGESVTLDAGSGFSTYNWSNNATTQTIAVASSGTYSVTVTNSGGCQAVASSSAIVVNPAPSTPVITTGGSLTFCSGGSVTLTATAGLSTYSWSNGATNQSIIISTSGNYTVTVTNTTGCSAVSLATTVTVNTLPVPSIAGSTTICSGSSSILDAGTGYNSYLWSTGETTQTISAGNAGVYGVTVTNGNGCTGANSITEVVGNALTPSISTNDSVFACEGNSVLLDPGNGFATYNWSNGESTQTIMVSTADSYSVTVTNSTGCSGVSNTAILILNPNPVFNSFVSPASICLGDTSTGTVDGDSAWNYIWNPGGIVGANSSLNPTATTTYTCVATNLNGCTSLTLSVVTVLPLPSIPIISQSGGTLTCNSLGAVSFQWYFNNGIINGATFSSYNAVQQIGNYSVEITDSNGCKNQSDDFNYLGDGIGSVSIKEVKIFPNPFAEIISIQNMNSETEIEILNVQGRIIFSKVSTNERETINTSEFSAGIYLLKVKSEGEIINRVVVKN